jgi:hypothetical protein
VLLLGVVTKLPVLLVLAVMHRTLELLQSAFGLNLSQRRSNMKEGMYIEDYLDFIRSLLEQVDADGYFE